MDKFFVVTSENNVYSSLVGEVGVILRESASAGGHLFIDGVFPPLLQHNEMQDGIEEVSSLNDILRTNEELSIW